MAKTPKKPDLQRERSFFNFSDLNEISEIFEDCKRVDDPMEIRGIKNESGIFLV